MQHQRLLEVDLVSQSCDARFQLHWWQQVFFRFVVPFDLSTQDGANVKAGMTNRVKYPKHPQYLGQERLHDRA